MGRVKKIYESEAGASARKTFAKEIHALGNWHRETAAYKFSEMKIAFNPEGVEDGAARRACFLFWCRFRLAHITDG
jgi:hypothetical protein